MKTTDWGETCRFEKLLYLAKLLSKRYGRLKERTVEEVEKSEVDEEFGAVLKEKLENDSIYKALEEKLSALKRRMSDEEVRSAAQYAQREIVKGDMRVAIMYYVQPQWVGVTKLFALAYEKLEEKLPNALDLKFKLENGTKPHEIPLWRGYVHPLAAKKMAELLREIADDHEAETVAMRLERWLGAREAAHEMRG